MQPRRQYQLQPLSPDKRRTALDSFDVYKPFVIEPKDVCWSALVTYFLSNPDAMSTTLLYAALQIALRQSQNVGKTRPLTVSDLVSRRGAFLDPASVMGGNPERLACYLCLKSCHQRYGVYSGLCQVCQWFLWPLRATKPSFRWKSSQDQTN